ncbi:hypothetical protein BN7_475 [Wickerhamomyces ciferrii]|uniref:Threonylcarbamoyl-AMP synthase n=1 Tax=Wickerhamomyces ciferrii (strain ATCC 14091 / BCRC 22168 / CBS 111 / JCM 3599 / NBRC 0793 / NRRL Y-1031 F-60-10) TaxID=1206466 RepID=K0KDF1_WICCF|nr:uncharacterized protein BN7_475 [Wickerhamomyces ciferrii]CCH40941.1 hypothetical protein BN7_475 [Wickerhamomyces ciferrii]
MNRFGKFICKMSTKAEVQTFKTEILPVSKSAIHFDSNDQLTINDESTEKNLLKAAKILSSSDQVVAFPSETVYGLGGSSFNDESIKNIYKAKNRPADNPLITHISSISQINSFFNLEIPEIYKPLIKEFWPGPLTILLPINNNDNQNKLSKLTTANQPTFAVRLPSHPIARALIHLSQVPIAAPSANASTRPSPTLAQHVYHDLQGKIPLILDGGASNVGVESTVIDGLSNPPMLLRPGGVSLEEIKKIGGKNWENIQVAKKISDPNEPVKTPGMKYKHYSPTAKVILVNNEETIKKYISENSLEDKKIALLTTQFFQGNKFNGIVDHLGKSKEEISSNLFSFLRKIDELGVDLIFVESVDEKNEGLAIMNRLNKAASETI